MIFVKTLRPRLIHTLFELQELSLYLKPPLHIDSTASHFISPASNQSFLRPSIFLRPISVSAQFHHEPNSKPIDSDSIEEINQKKKKPLDVLFKEAVGMSEKIQESESEDDGDNSKSPNETVELIKKLRKLEIEVKRLEEEEKGSEKKENSKKKLKREDLGLKDESKHRSLYGLFVNKEAAVDSRRVEDPTVYKELSPDMALFATYLYREGYFKNANFLHKDQLDVTCFQNSYGRNFLKSAAEKFGMNNQQLSMWLPGKDLRKVAQFGCPSLARKTVFSAKTLRTVFQIKEDTVCSKCVLKQSCKFVNQSVWKKGGRTLDLAVVMRVITLYALEMVPPQLVVPDAIKDTVNRLLKEIMRLGQTLS